MAAANWDPRIRYNAAALVLLGCEIGGLINFKGEADSIFLRGRLKDRREGDFLKIGRGRTRLHTGAMQRSQKVGLTARIVV